MTTLGTFTLWVGTRTLANMKWMTETLPTVTATDWQPYRLQFTSLTLDNNRPVLDNVQLQIAPAPSTLALFGCAAAWIVYARQREMLAHGIRLSAV